jgi:sulfide:quinone oxidoreductase
MARVIVLGAGLGGIPMAYELKEELRKEDKVTVVSDKDKYQFVPSNPWLAVNWRKPPDIEGCPLPPASRGKGSISCPWGLSA